MEMSEAVQVAQSLPYMDTLIFYFHHHVADFKRRLIVEMAAFLGLPENQVSFAYRRIDDSRPLEHHGTLIFPVPYRQAYGSMPIPPDAVYHLDMAFVYPIEHGGIFLLFNDFLYTEQELPALLDALWAVAMQAPHNFDLS